MLDGKVAIVTGGATLIGSAVVGVLSRYGARVVVADIDVEGGARVAKEKGATFQRTDVSDDASIEACVEETVKRTGRLDILVNLAAVYDDDGPESTREQWLHTLGVNVVGAALMGRAARPHLAAAPDGGVIVNIGSISGRIAQAGRWTYPVSKAAISQLTRNQAMDYAADGIRANTVSFGWTWSAIMQQLTGDDREKTDRVAADFHLTRRVADPEEVAEVIAFVCSDRASIVTGAEWEADGGYSAMGPEAAGSAIPRLME